MRKVFRKMGTDPKAILAIALLAGPARAQEFLAGVDASFVPELEGAGAVYLDENGQAADALAVYAAAGVTAKVATAGTLLGRLALFTG